MEALANLGWREALIAVIALLVLYMCAVLFRMWRLRRSRERDAAGQGIPVRSRGAAQAYAEEQAAEPGTAGGEPGLRQAEPTPVPPAPAPRRERDFPWNEPPPPFPGQERIEVLEREVAQLRYELDEQTAEVVSLREQLRREMTQTRAAQNVSPIYSDAMQMALQGHNAATISEHCGIARAEAELVVALVRNREDEE